MSIPIYRWNETSHSTKIQILQRAESDVENVKAVVQPILDDVRERGDKALVHYTQTFDGADISAKGLFATESEFEHAEKNLSPSVKEAIRSCISNVRRFHEAQLAHEKPAWMMEVNPGVWAGEKTSPIPSVGLYVPRGKGAFPSVMYMLGIPAVIANVPNIVVCTPPTATGSIDDATLFAAQCCGIHNIVRVGGAQAIAALAYGTESIPAVVKVVGPGNIYVTAAKRLLAHKIDPGLPAGPSEAIILADASAHPYNTALDLLNEAEHGPDSASLLVTPSETLANAVQAHLPGLIAQLPEPRREFCQTVFQTYGGIVLTSSVEEAIHFCNEYAPEHLLLKVSSPQYILPQLHHAGEILIGEYTPIAMGNFGIGVNAILPTGRHARTSSATSVRDFLKRTSIALNTHQGFDALKQATSILADYEGFPAHSNAIIQRITHNIPNPAFDLSALLQK